MCFSTRRYPLNYIRIRHGLYMAEQRRVILHIATSKDGFIATLDDGLDWLPAVSYTHLRAHET